MWAVLRAITRIELLAAMHLGTVGDWWAASAARRLRKLSEKVQGGSSDD